MSELRHLARLLEDAAPPASGHARSRALDLLLEQVHAEQATARALGIATAPTASSMPAPRRRWRAPRVVAATGMLAVFFLLIGFTTDDSGAPQISAAVASACNPAPAPGATGYRMPALPDCLPGSPEPSHDGSHSEVPGPPVGPVDPSRGAPGS